MLFAAAHARGGFYGNAVKTVYAAEIIFVFVIKKHLTLG
jgi:hypothetical protein